MPSFSSLLLFLRPWPTRAAAGQPFTMHVRALPCRAGIPGARRAPGARRPHAAPLLAVGARPSTRPASHHPRPLPRPPAAEPRPDSEFVPAVALDSPAVAAATARAEGPSADLRVIAARALKV